MSKVTVAREVWLPFWRDFGIISNSFDSSKAAITITKRNGRDWLSFGSSCLPEQDYADSGWNVAAALEQWLGVRPSLVFVKSEQRDDPQYSTWSSKERIARPVCDVCWVCCWRDCSKFRVSDDD